MSRVPKQRPSWVVLAPKAEMVVPRWATLRMTTGGSTGSDGGGSWGKTDVLGGERGPAARQQGPDDDQDHERSRYGDLGIYGFQDVQSGSLRSSRATFRRPGFFILPSGLALRICKGVRGSRVPIRQQVRSIQDE